MIVSGFANHDNSHGQSINDLYPRPKGRALQLYLVNLHSQSQLLQAHHEHLGTLFELWSLLDSHTLR